MFNFGFFWKKDLKTKICYLYETINHIFQYKSTVIRSLNEVSQALIAWACIGEIFLLNQYPGIGCMIF